jgi:hypothetical protein
VWSGNTGTFTAKAIAKPKKSHRPVDVANAGVLGDLDEVERDAVDTVAAGDEHRRHDRHEHERRADHRVEEELHGRVLAALVAPAADEEVHRHEHDLEEHEEQEQVEAQERAHHAGLEQQQPREVRLVLRGIVVVRVDAEDGEREQHAGQQHEEQRDAVDTEVPADPPLLDPRVLRHELEAVVGLVELGREPHGHRSGGDRADRRDELHELGATLGEQDDQRGSRGREHDEHRQDREREIAGRAGGEHHSTPRPMTNQAKSRTTPTPSTPA